MTDAQTEELARVLIADHVAEELAARIRSLKAP